MDRMLVTVSRASARPVNSSGESTLAQSATLALREAWISISFSKSEANAGSAIFNMTPAEVFSDPDGFALEMKQIRETLDVMKALGISPVNIPGVPVKALCFAVRCLPGFLTRPILVKAVGGGRGGKMPSFYIDLHAGRKESEVEFLNGAVVRYGEKLGVDTPVNKAYYEVLTQLARGTLPLNTYERNPGKLRSDRGC